MATITVNGTLVNDQTLGLQDDDDAIDNTLAGLTAAFVTFLNNLPVGVNALTTSQKDFAGGVDAAISGDTFVSVDPQGSNVSDLFFSDASGNALDGDQVIFNGNPLQTVSGQNIYLWSFGDVALATTGNTVANKGDVVAAFYLNEAVDHETASIETVTFIPIAHPTASNPDDRIDWTSLLNVSAATSIDFGFAGAPSGANLFMTFGNPNSVQIVVIGQDPLNQSEGGKINTKDVLNISQAGSTTSFGVNGNQINPDEGAFITYVTGANTQFLVPNLDQNEADIEANIDFKNVFDTTGAGFTVNQTNPGVGPVTVRITAFDTDAEPGEDFVDGLTDDGDNIDITSFSITNFVVKGETAPTATITDGVLIVTGLSTGDKVQWTTSGTHNRVLIENISNADGPNTKNDNNTFDIGGFSLTQGAVVTTSVGDDLFVDDDGPDAGVKDAVAAAIVLDESPVPPDDDGVTTATADYSINFNSPTDFGTDGKGSASFALKLTGTDVGSGLYALDAADTTTGDGDGIGQGAEILLNQSGNTVTGSVGTTDYFTIAVDPTNGKVTFTQLANIWHDDTKNPDDVETLTTAAAGDLQLVQTVKDADGDSDSAAIDLGAGVFKIEDDGPDSYDPQNQSLLNLAGASISGDLDTGGNTGTDGFGSIVFTGFANGDAAKTTGGTPLTSDGKAIELNGAGTGLLTGYVDLDNDNVVDTGETVFTVKLDPTTDTYQFTLVKDIDDGSSTVTLSFDDVVGGQEQWFFFDANEGPNNDQDVLFTSKLQDSGKEEQTANTSATDIGVANQWIGDSKVPTDEGVRIDFAIDVNGGADIEDALNEENGFLFSNHFKVNNAGFTINQTLGSGTSDIKVRLSDATNDVKTAGTSYNNFLAQSTVAIIGIVVTNGTTTKVEGVDYTVTGPDADGFMTISGLDEEDHINLVGAQDYERIEINYASGAAFAINEITYDQSTAGNPLDLQFKTLLADGDGDTSSGLIDVNLQPADNSADTFTGDIGHDALFGGGGNDTISGGEGNDTINGGIGSDALSGGKGSDTYVYQTLADGKDSISDFDITAPGSGGDILDISAVLDIAGNTWADGGTVADAITGEYITFTDVGGFAQVNVDIDGKAGAAFTPTAMAVLTGVSFATAAADLNDNIVVG